MKLNKLGLKDRPVFEKYLNLKKHELSVYAFENIYIWLSHFDIEWALSEDSLCIFFKDKRNSFLYLPPLGRSVKPETVQGCFEIMDNFNKNQEASRIENIEDIEVEFYRGLGFDLRRKSQDYLCLREDIAGLKGNKFKSQRASFNYFSKNNRFELIPLSPDNFNGCIELYKEWSRQRQEVYKDNFYKFMLEDSQKTLDFSFKNFEALNFSGAVVMISGVIKGFTLGFRLNKETFCVLFEITDLSIKGLAQFIFSQFCRSLESFKFVNIMDDSGLDNLKKVKLAYKPCKLVAAYNATRKNA